MDSSASTAVALDFADTRSQLILSWRGRTVQIGASGELLLGRHADCSLVLAGTYLSRWHASLSWQRNGFELTDHSSNGLYVQLEDEQVRFVHRSALRLWGSGYLSFGEPPNAANAVRFQHA